MAYLKWLAYNVNQACVTSVTRAAYRFDSDEASSFRLR